MKNIGLDKFTIFETYAKEIWSVLEHIVPAWHGELIKYPSRTTKRIKNEDITYVSNCQDELKIDDCLFGKVSVS